MTDRPTDHSGAPVSGLVALLSSEEVKSALDALATAPSPLANPVVTATRLRRHSSPEVVAAAMTLHELRARAAVKFSQANAMLFTRAGYEQASSERIARWRARRFAGCRSVADLCCGIGGDLMALAETSGIERLMAVDLDPDHLAMALANAALVAPNTAIAGRSADVRAVDLAGVDGVFIDPARRNAGGRFSSGETEPPLAWCLALVEQVPRVGIKLAPGIDHASIPADWELETIALDNDLKEAVLWSPALATAPRRATVIQGGEAFTIAGDGDDALPDERRGPLAAPEPGRWLHDPNPAVTRAGLVGLLGEMLGAQPIDRQIAFLTGAAPADSPFARSRRIVASLPWDERTLRAALTELGAGAIDIRRRGLAGDVEAIVRRIRKGFPKGGNHSYWIAMTRADNRPWAIVCEETAENR